MYSRILSKTTSFQDPWRKLVQTEPTSSGFSIPRDLAVEHVLPKNDEVFLEAEGATVKAQLLPDIIDLINNEDPSEQLECEIGLGRLPGLPEIPENYVAADDDCILLVKRSNDIKSGVSEMRYVDTMPEYPQTRDDGFAYCVDIRGYPASDYDIYGIQKEVQYSRGTNKTNTTKLQKCPFFHDEDCIFRRYHCGGVKLCRYAHPQLQAFKHQEVTEKTWISLATLQTQRPLENSDQSQREGTFALYNSALKQYSKGRKCIPPCTNGQLTLKRLERLNRDQSPQYFLSCSKWYRGDKRNHWKLFFKVGDVYEPDLLRKLCQNDEILTDITNDSCFTVKPIHSGKSCDGSHPEGNQQLLEKKCDVRFALIIPQDLVRTPFVVWASWGVHNHPPPPPVKTPSEIERSIRTLVRQVDTADLTSGKFLRSEICQAFLRKGGFTSLGSVHPSLNNQSAIAAILKKQQIIDYPLGSDVAALFYEYQRSLKDPEKPTNIQFFLNDGVNIAIFCMTLQQAQILGKIRSLQVDMTYKRVRGAISEVIFTHFDSITNRVMVLARVFTNKDCVLMYQLIFTYVFSAFQKHTGSPFLWKHIHGTGCEVLVADCCWKQAIGFGRYLETIDPTREWRQHIQRTMIYCLVHFFRGLQQKFRGSEHYQEMRSLPDQPSKPQALELLHRLLRTNDENVKNWARHKQYEWVLSGYNPYCSQLPLEVWKSIKRHTNSTESANFSTNATGTGTSLLTAWKRSSFNDNANIERKDILIKYRVGTESRDITPQARHSKNNQRSLTRRLNDAKANQELQMLPDILSTPSSDGKAIDIDDFLGISSCGTPPTPTPTISKVKRARSQTTKSIIEAQDEQRQRVRLEIKQKELELAEKELQIQERQLALRERQAELGYMDT